MKEYLKQIKFIPKDKIKSPEDKRDYIFNASVPFDISLPSSFSWKNKVKYILDQKDKGICVGCSSVAIKNIQELLDNDLPVNGFSPMYNYVLDKQIDGIPNIEGTYLRVSMDVMLRLGSLPVQYLPMSSYIDDNIFPSISELQITKALPYKIKSYANIPYGDITALKRAILESPVMLAILVTDTFMFPEQNKFAGYKLEGNFYGGHAITAISFDDNLEFTYADGHKEKGFIEIQNSWGCLWGNQGNCYIPYSAFKYKTLDGQPYVVEMWSCVDDHSNKKEENKKYWRVQLYAFKNKQNCYNQVIKLKEQGFSTYVVQKDGWYKIQLGAFSVEQNGRNYLQEVRNKGYKDAFLTYY